MSLFCSFMKMKTFIQKNHFQANKIKSSRKLKILIYKNRDCKLKHGFSDVINIIMPKLFKVNTIFNKYPQDGEFWGRFLERPWKLGGFKKITPNFYWLLNWWRNKNKKCCWMLVYFWNLGPHAGWKWVYIVYAYIRKCFKGTKSRNVCICIIHL